MIPRTGRSKLLKASGCRLPVNLHGSYGLAKAAQEIDNIIQAQIHHNAHTSTHHLPVHRKLVNLSQELDSPLARSEPVHGRKRLVLTSGRSLAPLYLRHCALLSKDERGAICEPEVDLGNVSKRGSSEMRKVWSYV
jgi:hypothetical protein